MDFMNPGNIILMVSSIAAIAAIVAGLRGYEAIRQKTGNTIYGAIGGGLVFLAVSGVIQGVAVLVLRACWQN